ncbi:MAG: hypothetical protein R3315_06940 [Woeseiaceae bacterium]|nr:hypothetical protein [Woeseiaceae bacterium]
MARGLLYSGLYLLGVLILSCLVTLMIAFMGGSFAGGDLSGLFIIQAAAIPVALLVVAREVAAFVGPNGWRRGLGMLWERVPAWLVLALVLLNSLVLIGELSVLLLQFLLDEPLSWVEQVPLIALLVSSVAFSILYAKAASLYGKATTQIGRWL